MIYTGDEIKKLSAKISSMPKVADKAAADTINKSATFAIKASIEEITSEVNLTGSYIKKHVKTVARAHFSNLRAVVSASERGTLMYNYPSAKTKDGYKVAINRTGGYREIANARMMTLNGSGRRTIGVRNIDAVEIFKVALTKGKRTSAKSRKLQKIIAKARNKPYGMTPLHSRSVNQLFESVREDIQPELGRFMRETFLQDFKRLNK